MLLFLFGLLVFVFVALLVVVATIGATIASLVTLVTAPSQLGVLLRDKQLRRNHALEHATINVIEERLGPSRLAGLAQRDGFVIRGGAPPDLVAVAAQEALARLKAGERRLAIHPRCGTTLVASQLVMGVTFLAVLIALGQLTWLPFLAGLVVSALLGPRLSPILQRYVTTDWRVGNLGITSIEVQAPAGRLGLLSLVVLGPILVRTAEATPGETPQREGARMTVITGDREEVAAGGYRVR
jgi:hypothetical protein